MNKKRLSMIVLLVVVSTTISMFSSVTAVNLDFEREESSSLNDSDGDGILNRWAVIIGTDPKVYSTNDANSMYATLKNNGWKATHIKKYTRFGATKDKIFDGIEWMASRADNDDLVLFYFSGHGGRRVIADYYSNPIFLIELKQAFRRGKSYFQLGTQQIFIFDTCHAGSLKEDTDYIEWVNDTAYNEHGLKLKYFYYDGEEGGGDDEIDTKGILGLSGTNRIVITSCKSSEYSYGDPQLRHGVFSYYLIESLKTENADTNNFGKGDGWISAEEAFDYSEPRTKEFTRVFLIICRQHPQISDKIGGQATLTNAGKEISKSVVLNRLLTFRPKLILFLQKLLS